MYGLAERDIAYMIKGIKKFREIDKVILYGSRAMANYKIGSDVDLAIVGEEVSEDVITKLDDLLNEVYPIPYFFDLLHYEALNNKELQEHIHTVGKLLYQRV